MDELWKRRTRKPRGFSKGATKNYQERRAFDGTIYDFEPDEPDIDLDGAAPAAEVPPTATKISERDIEDLRAVLVELASREKESLRLYRPMAVQEEFHACPAPERIIRGGNRGGKTLASAVEFARAVTGQDPHDKYPKRDGRAIVVGKDLLHCSKVLYRKLFKPGAFKIVRDEVTQKWRAYDPTTDGHLADFAKDAPPLIPRRFYDPRDTSWENKREEIPKTVRLKNGWEVTFFSSLGEPPQGWDVDLAWFDEEIEHPLWYPEISARLIDRGGRFMWSATPQSGTIQLYELSVRAAEGRSDPACTIREFHCTLLENKFMSEKDKADFIGKIKNEDEIQIRVYGNFALAGMRVYPEFHKTTHKVAAFPIPDDWTRYVAIDPGRQVCAVLFCAVPPPSHPLAGKRVLYDELYIRKASAATVAQRLHAKVVNQDIYAAYIDHHAGRITEIGSGKSIESQYQEAMKAMGIKFSRSGTCSFEWGSDDVKAGIEAVRSGLHLVDGKPAVWLVFADQMPNFCWEADTYSFKKAAGKSGAPSDEPIKLNDHLMDCWRYLAMANLRYVKPRSSKTRPSYTAEILKRKREKRRAQMGWDGSVKVG